MANTDPVLIDLEGDATMASVAEALPVPDVDTDVPRGQAMQLADGLAVRKPSRLIRWFWALAAGLVGAMASIALWDFVTGLVARSPILGWGVAALTTAFLGVLLTICLREIAALGRLGRLDAVRRDADSARAADDLNAARRVSDQLLALYKGRDDTRWGRDRFAELHRDQMDADSLLALVDAEILRPLDAAASREIEAAARQVATVTALVPLAFADVAAALAANLRMIRRIAEIYGGRSGFWGGWRLTRAVIAHMVATGAVAVGDDLLEPILGGTIIGKLSRRFGEGLVNGALTARVGVAALEVCRPLSFVAGQKPKVRDIIKRSLGGIFSPPRS